MLERIKQLFGIKKKAEQTQPMDEKPLSTLYECYNCGTKREELYECDTCHGFFCFQCSSSHECIVASQPPDTSSVAHKVDRTPAQEPVPGLGKDFQEGLIAMSKRHDELVQAAKDGENPPRPDNRPIKRELISDGTGKIHEEYHR